MDLNFGVPHFIMVGWLIAGFSSLWLAQRLRYPTQKIVQNILLPMALGLVIFATYVNVGFNYDFLIDDIDIVEMNPDVRDADGWQKLWGHDYWSGRSTDDNLYRPIVILSYWLNARMPMSGLINEQGQAVEMYPRYFRGVNMILLALLAWIIALWLMTWVQPTAAWIAAFLFAMHPSHAVVVNYIVGRADLLAVLGIAWFLYLQRLSIMTGRWSWKRKAFAVIAVIIAIGSKETGLILIPAAAVQAWIGRRDANTDITDTIKTTPTPTYIWTCIILLVPTLLYFVGRLNAVGISINYVGVYMDDIRDNPLRMVDALDRIPAAFSIAWFYLSQIIAPNTSYYHIPSQVPTWSSFSAIAGFLLLILCMFAFVYSIKKRHWMAPVLTLALGQYILVGNLIKPIGVYAANRLMLPFTLAAALACGAILHRFCQKSMRKRAVAMLPAMVALLLMAIVIQGVTHDWGTKSRLTGRDYRRAPSNPVTMYNFATTRALEASYLVQYLDILDDATDLFATYNLDVTASTNVGRNSLKLSMLLDRIDSLARHDSQWSAPVPHKGTIHERLEHSNELKTAIQRLRKSFSSPDEVLVTATDLDAIKKRLHTNLQVNQARLNSHFREAISLLEDVTEKRPDSLNAPLALTKVHINKSDYHNARATEYGNIKDKQKKNNEIIAATHHRKKARKICNEIINRTNKLNDIRTNELRVRFSKLCIDLSVTPEDAEQSLVLAANSLAKQIELIKTQVTTSPLDDSNLAKLQNLHKNALRYYGVIAWKNHQLELAIQRHTTLLTLYPNFKAAQQDHSQWIDLLNP
jgi:hypothetical protein